MAEHVGLACIRFLRLIQHHERTPYMPPLLILYVNFTISQGLGHYFSGGILVFALIYALYSFGVYMFRRQAIESREVDGHYDDAWYY